MDTLSEAWTHADGLIGQFKIGHKGKTDVMLFPTTTQIVILEAKLLSGLSYGVKNASSFNQAARSVACIAEMLHRANVDFSKIERLGFYVLAPEKQIERGLFRNRVNWPSISEHVADRVISYGGTKENWYRNWFKPMQQFIKIGVLSWEDILDKIAKSDKATAEDFKGFYEKALILNDKSRGIAHG